MLQSFLTYINDHRIFKSTDRVLLAVSGGIDSVVLVDLFARANFSFALAHCNFQLRGDDSNLDEELTQNLAQNHGVACYTKKFDVETYCNQNGVSTQMAARDLRYAWFEEVRTTHHFDFLATAHHQNDSIETVLLNVVRGTGIAGFHGILPKQHFVIRPLLFATKAQIVDFANAQKLTWREDTSNKSSKYQRNFIRHQVIPLLKTVNPQFENGLANTMEQLTAVENIFNQKVNEIKAEAVYQRNGYTEIKHQVLRTQSEPVVILFNILKPYGFDYQQSKIIWFNIDNQSGSRFISDNWILFKDRECFIIKNRGKFLQQNTANPIFIWPHAESPGIKLEILKAGQLSADQLKFGVSNEIFLDSNKLSFPLKLRTWETGDWFCPFGMNGRRKKVSDFLIDIKYPLPLKAEVKVLVSADSIVWLVGHRTDERFKVNPESENIFKIKII